MPAGVAFKESSPKLPSQAGCLHEGFIGGYIRRLQDFYICRSLDLSPVLIEFGLGVEAQAYRPLGSSFLSGRHGKLNVARRAVVVVCRCCCRCRFDVVVVVVVIAIDISFNTFDYDLHMRLAYAQLLIPSAPDVIKPFNKYATPTNSSQTELSPRCHRCSSMVSLCLSIGDYRRCYQACAHAQQDCDQNSAASHENLLLQK